MTMTITPQVMEKIKELVAEGLSEIAPEPAGHGLPLSKCEAYNRVYEQPCGSS